MFITLILLLLAPVVGLFVFSLGVVFWTSMSHLKFVSYYRSQGETPPAMSARDWVSFYLNTLVGALHLLWWSIRATGQAKYRPPTTDESGRPVLCLHGIFMNSSCMWGIRRALEREGRGTRAVSMGVPIPTPLAYAGPLTSVMDEMAKAFPEKGFDVVAHSLGGVMLREVLRRRPDLAPRVGRIVTLGTPHHGTAFVRWIRIGPLYRMLNRKSEYLKELPDFLALAPSAGATTVTSKHDLVVYPPPMALLDGTDQITLDQVSHLGLMVRPKVMRVIIDSLQGRD